MSRSVLALYPFQFQEPTIRKLRENISQVNEILQQAASSFIMYVASRVNTPITRKPLNLTV
jgi:hypothetical protein